MPQLEKARLFLVLSVSPALAAAASPSELTDARITEFGRGRYRPTQRRRALPARLLLPELRGKLYPVSDLASAKALVTRLLGVEPSLGRSLRTIAATAPTKENHTDCPKPVRSSQGTPTEIAKGGPVLLMETR